MNLNNFRKEILENEESIEHNQNDTCLVGSVGCCFYDDFYGYLRNDL